MGTTQGLGLLGKFDSQQIGSNIGQTGPDAVKALPKYTALNPAAQVPAGTASTSSSATADSAKVTSQPAATASKVDTRTPEQVRQDRILANDEKTAKMQKIMGIMTLAQLLLGFLFKKA